MVTNHTLKKNLKLAYGLVFLHNSFFWYAPWLLFFLNFISLAQAAVLQSVALLVSVVSEVPTGALADLIGKKRTLNIAFLLTGIGELYMAFSNSFGDFAISYVIQNIGNSFYSGTMEAFAYDTLVANKKEHTFAKVISRFQAFANAGTAISSIAGGVLYGVWIGLPFLLTGVTKLVGFVVSLFVDEPAVDTDTFSWQNFVAQTQKGFRFLFSQKLLGFTVLLLTFSVFHVPAYEIIDDLVVIDYGYAASAIGILYAISVVIAIPSSLLYEKVAKRVSPLVLVFIGVFVLGLHYVFTPWIGVVAWTILFLARVFYSSIRNNAVSEILNKNTESKIRATTLSTYSMLKIIPFVLMAGLIGTGVERVGLRPFAAGFYGLMLVLTVPQMIRLAKNRFRE